MLLHLFPWIWLVILLSHLQDNGFTAAIDSSYDFLFFPPEFIQLERDKRYSVINIERLGLMNRLRTIVDWYFISKLANRRLIVNWIPNRDCNVDFYDLFDDYPKDLIVLRRPIPTVKDSLEWVVSVSQRYNFTYKMLSHESTRFNRTDNNEYLWGRRNLSIFAAKDVLLRSQENLLLTDYDGVLTIEDMPCIYYFHQHGQILAQFSPKIHIKQLADQVMNFFTDTIPIGVHIRMHDTRYDWEIIPPMTGSRAKAFGDGASLDDFITIMKHIVDQNQFPIPFTSASADSGSTMNSEAKRKPLIRFFIASNDFLVKQEILKLFPNAISLTSEISRETIAGIDHAFIEWIILSKCKLIIHTFASSFATEAAILNQVPLISIWEHRYLLQQSYAVKYCGNLQFAKYFSSNGVPSYIEEGETVNNRKVQGIAIAHKPCDRLPNGNIPNLLCIADNF